VDIKIYGQALRKGSQNIAIAEGRCGITWINVLNLFHISIYELNLRAFYTYERNINLQSFAAGHLKAASFGTFSHNLCFILKNIWLAWELLWMWL